ncbi:putative 3-hydroxyacyl-CoA dehydrogenase [Sistotremastrum suecicum HHB10207 ss-3]|uniref:Putative 3-hydroxyacyl-CoA dehydrogenase n=1 Tax=Sistotremastrum suecicum HHB10207 ss-3 TaxID=1314776 RepID=A0A166CY51_9AGAM|nr:putative 3-hydroxyacyl-CoA dehydrogenase [Sistotremastrum suecicum HHB10207 ss-3]
MRIADRTFIISGGSSGLGLAAVEALHESGAYIAVFDLRKPVNDFQGLPRVAFFKADVTQTMEIQEAVDKTIEWTKATQARLGGVIACAGTMRAGKIVSRNGTPYPLDTWNKIMDVNLTGTFNLVRLALQHLINVDPEGADDERGVIIMTSSSEAFEGHEGQLVYAASKGAIRSMTLPMARDLGRYGIRVATIAPSPFDTPMASFGSPRVMRTIEDHFIFPRRIGKPKEFADTIKWIIECPYANGDTFRLSGGNRIPGKL